MVVGQDARAGAVRDHLKPMLTRLGQILDRRACTFSLLLTDDRGISEYNRRFRGVDEPTDVLSFPSGTGSPEDSGHYLGDLVISLERAAEQASEQGHAVVAEIEVLVLHGVLHLLGHDHEADQGQMRELEARLARELFGDVRGLTERAQDEDEPAG